MTDETQALLESADRALEAARILLEHEMRQDAANRIYYAMFYAAQALLRLHEIEANKHSAVESALGYHFVRTGKMDSSFHRLFINARKEREFADYGIMDESVQPRLDLSLDDGRRFVEEMKRLISEN
ncbi:MAG: HEPN domain-containing protein [Planctomycetota bacterium]